MAKKSKIDFDEVMAAAAADENLGFRLACGAQNDGCEPDMRKGECEICGEFQVYGAEEILIGGIASVA